MPEQLRRHRPAIDALFPEGGNRAIEAADAPPGLALADSILAILQHSLGARHALLIVDDLQWADSDVLAVLNRIVRSQMPCTTVVATRPLDREGDYLLQFFSDLRRTVETEHLELAPLSVAEVSDLLRRTVGLAATSFALDVHERTGGHPFLIRQLLDTGQLNATADTFDLPRTVTEATRRSLLRLSDDGRTVVDAAAILGRTSTFMQLAGFTAFEEPRLLAALQELCDERVLTEPATDEFAFAHVLAQQAVTESIVSRQRRRLHARARGATSRRRPTRCRTSRRAGRDTRGRGRSREVGRQRAQWRRATPGARSGSLPQAPARTTGSGLGGGLRVECMAHRAPPPMRVGLRSPLWSPWQTMMSRTRVRMEWLVARVALELGEMAEYDAAVEALIGLVESIPAEDRADLALPDRRDDDAVQSNRRRRVGGAGSGSNTAGHACARCCADQPRVDLDRRARPP